VPSIVRSTPNQVDSLAQQALAHHFDEFDYILAMDVNNLRNLERIRPKGSKARLQLFGEYGDGRPLSDPYCMSHVASRL
jgi:low molecular weight phosphotyrosine protein phosphatase